MISVTLETVIVRLSARNLADERDQYALPESFGPGDGIIRVTVHPVASDVQAYAQTYPRLKAHLADDELANTVARCQWTTMQAASHLYQSRYGVDIVEAQG